MNFRFWESLPLTISFFLLVEIIGLSSSCTYTIVRLSCDLSYSLSVLVPVPPTAGVITSLLSLLTEFALIMPLFISSSTMDFKFKDGAFAKLLLVALLLSLVCQTLGESTGDKALDSGWLYRFLGRIMNYYRS